MEAGTPKLTNPLYATGATAGQAPKVLGESSVNLTVAGFIRKHQLGRDLLVRECLGTHERNLHGSCSRFIRPPFVDCR
jgi:hypothetical protein